MSQLWTIVEVATGKVLYDGFRTPSEGAHPKDWGWDWNPATQKATRIDKEPDTTRQSFVSGSWSADLAKAKALAIQQYKDEAEQLKMLRMSPGGAKKEEYAANKAEVRDADQLGGALLTTLSALRMTVGAMEARFPQAAANAAEFGDTIPDALNRFRGGIARAAPCPKISAREARLCADIRAATDFATFNAVIAKHKWPAA